jgi:glycerol-3-phosphate dehydrogenase
VNRDQAIAQLDAVRCWDLLVIGGGAAGLGCAVDSSARGYRTLLLEQADFAQGTSSRSTKLIHGGVRYLKQGNLSLVLEALHERGLLCRNAPHLVHHLAFVVPVYHWWEGPFYGIGLKLYDRLAGQLGLGPSKRLSREETLRRIPTLEPMGLQGGICYFDGQFDDARLAVNLAQTVFDQGGCAINYLKVIGFIRERGVVVGVHAQDVESQRVWDVRTRVAINAGGVLSDAVRRLDEPASPPVITASQGAHLVLPRAFLPGETAIMVPHTPDGRVLFALPWQDRVIVGTTDTPVDALTLDPHPLEQEIEFLLTTAAQYLRTSPQRTDVLSMFAGLRPLVRAGDTRNTAALSRDHTLLISDSGLVSIVGGKWTTYRRMAEDAVDQAAMVGGLDRRPCGTRELPLHGHRQDTNRETAWPSYGSDAAGLRQLMEEEPALEAALHPNLSYREAEVVWAVRQEMARTVGDVCARRTRALLLDARASIEMAPRVARRMALELGRDAHWERQAVEGYTTVARHYLPRA